MKTSLPTSLLCGLLLCLVGFSGRAGVELALGQDSQQADTISVRVASGRVFVGQLDARTDAGQLWLRSGHDSLVLLRPIQWDRVVQVSVADQDLSGEEFRQIVRTVKPADPASETRVAGPKEITITGGHESDVAPEAVRAEPPELPRVRSLAIDAAVANWDADVEVDGLVVHVYPLDEGGRLIPARGTLQFDLTGQREGEFRHWQAFSPLGQWTEQARAEDYGPQGVVYRLPFRGIHPEFDLAVAPHAALHARLSVPGLGTFETTESMLRIRPYSAVRDRLQLSTGSRFFPQERTTND
jgi:hypothetical protein